MAEDLDLSVPLALHQTMESPHSTSTVLYKSHQARQSALLGIDSGLLYSVLGLRLTLIDL